MHGFGEYHYKNGKIYKGEFRFGQMHGFGKITEPTVTQTNDDEGSKSNDGSKNGWNNNVRAASDIKAGMEHACIFYKDKRVCWWEDLSEGRRIQIYLPNVGFRGEESDGKWFDATIIQYDRNRKPENSTKRGKEHLIKFEYDIPPPGTGFKECEWMNLSQVRFKVRGGGKNANFTIGKEIPLRHTVINLRTETKLCIDSSKESDILGNNIEFKALLRKGFERDLDRVKENKQNTPTKGDGYQRGNYYQNNDYSSKYDDDSDGDNGKNRRRLGNKIGALKQLADANSPVHSERLKDKNGLVEYSSNSKSKHKEGSNLKTSITVYQGGDHKNKNKQGVNKEKRKSVHEQHMSIFENEAFHTNKSDVLERTLKLRERLGKQLALR